MTLASAFPRQDLLFGVLGEETNTHTTTSHYGQRKVALSQLASLYAQSFPRPMERQGTDTTLPFRTPDGCTSHPVSLFFWRP